MAKLAPTIGLRVKNEPASCWIYKLNIGYYTGFMNCVVQKSILMRCFLISLVSLWG